jgi:uroporphyrinogen decarboxylase
MEAKECRAARSCPALAQGDTLNPDQYRFIRACRRQPVDATPVWFMRQAGRYMAEYRALRERYSLLDLCRTPDLATEVTMQPVRRIELDAAILFSDLLLPLEPMGIRFDFVRGEGPQIENPLSTEADIDRLRTFESREALAHVLQAIRQIQVELNGRMPLIGFAGAPFTLASYAIEGGHSNNFARTKALMYGHPEAGHRLCALFADTIGEYLVAQIEAGVDVVQVFDSWVGALNAADYREFILPHSRRIFEIVTSRSSVPTIHFGVGTWSILAEMRAAGGDVIGADWRTPLDEAWDRIGHDRAIQGNLDPTLLLGPIDRLFAGADDVLARAAGRPDYIFTLAHGILPPSPVDHVQALARYVHQQTRR